MKTVLVILPEIKLQTNHFVMKRLLAITALLAFYSTTTIAQQGKQKAIVMNHLAFHVTNLQVSTDFYTSIIGLDTIPEPFHDGKHTWLSLGNGSHLHLIQAAGTPTIPGKNTHLCLSVGDVNGFVNLLKEHHLAFEDWAGTASAITTRVDGVHQVYLKDPDGYWLEINDATH
jgi:lactoylglutathione lyase